MVRQNEFFLFPFVIPTSEDRAVSWCVDYHPVYSCSAPLFWRWFVWLTVLASWALCEAVCALLAAQYFHFPYPISLARVCCNLVLCLRCMGHVQPARNYPHQISIAMV